MTDVEAPDDGIAPAAARPWEHRTERLPSWSRPWSYRCYMAAVFFLPVQLELSGIEDLVDSRLSPSDLLLALSLLVAPTSIRFYRHASELLPYALVVTLSYGALVALVVEGTVTEHTIFVKFLGAIVLALFCIVTMAYVRTGFGLRIVRAFLIGVTISALLAWVDWKLVNLLPFVDAKIDSRFGGMVYDPNNAGALFGVSLMLAWHVGPKVFRHASTHVSVVLVSAFSLVLTYSRGGWIAFAAGTVAVAALTRLRARHVVRLGVVAFVALSALFLTGAIDDAIEDFNSRPDNVESRGELAQGGLERYVESNGAGIGLGTYRLQVDEIIHNTALWLLVEMSLVGVLFFVAMCALPARTAFAGLSIDRRLALGLLGAHVVVVVASVGIEALYQRHWWLIVGLTSFVYIDSNKAAAASDVVRAGPST